MRGSNAMATILVFAHQIVQLVALDRETNSNLALSKPTWQHTVFEDWGPENAVDGDRNPSDFSCSRTISTEAWWQVDLKANYLVSFVRITSAANRSLGLVHFKVEVSLEEKSKPRTTDNECIRVDQMIPVGQTYSYRCKKPIWGRYVKIEKYKHSGNVNPLTLCEVEVFDSSPWRLKKVVSTRYTKDDVIKTIPGRLSPVQCAKLCVHHEGRACLYIQMYTPTGGCQLLHTMSYDGDLTKGPQWAAYAVYDPDECR